MNNNSLKFGQSGLPSITATQLDLIASAIVTFGDALGTIAAALALEAEIQEEENQEIKEQEMNRMQKQIDYLTNELSKLKKQRPELLS